MISQINNNYLMKNKDNIICRDALSASPTYKKHTKPKSAGNESFKRHNKKKFLKTERMRKLNKK